jgi:hypothetical protein
MDALLRRRVRLAIVVVMHLAVLQNAVGAFERVRTAAEN